MIKGSTNAQQIKPQKSWIMPSLVLDAPVCIVLGG
jgi:hypothetical protein